MVSPLVNCIQDQVHKLANVGILPLLLVISVNKMQEVYGQGNGGSKTCKGRQPVFLSQYEILHIALTRSHSDFLHLRNVQYVGHLFFAASFL